VAGAERIGGGRFAAPWLRSRVLRAALVVSVLLHVAILLGLPELIAAKRQAWVAPLSARLAEPPPAPNPEPAERKPGPAPQAAPVVPKPAPRVVPKAAKPAPVPAPVATEAPRSEPVLAAPAQPSAAVGVDSAPPPAKSEARVGPASAPAPAFDEAGTIAQYRIALMQVASTLKTYPRIAQENNWQGRVELRLTVGAGGGITSLAVKSGTGYAVLDQHALDMLRRAQPKTPLPAGLRGREFTLEVPVVFGLNDG